MKLHTIDGIEVFVEEADRYVQINDISGKDLSVVWETLQKDFHGYELVLCFRDVVVPVEALATIKAEVLEDCITMTVTQDGFVSCGRDDVTDGLISCDCSDAIPDGLIPCNCSEISPLEKSGFAAFAALHDKINPECGGTSQGIWRKWDNWRVLLLRKNGEIIGYTILLVALRDTTMGEIFCVWAGSHAYRKALLSAVVQIAFENGKDVVLYMVDRDNTDELTAATEVGFQEVGYYVGYRVECIR